MSTTYSTTRDALITSVLKLQGWLDYTATADATKLAQMADSLQMMIKAWSAKEIKLWCVEELTLPLVSSQRSYTIGPSGANLTANRPLRIIEAFIRYGVGSTTPNDVTLQPLSRNEYQMLGSKSTTSTPNSFFYDAQIPSGVLYLYVSPDAYSATNNEVHLFSHRLIQDMNSSGATFDFPQEWYQALRWGLAAETAFENQVPMEKAQGIEQKARAFMEEIENWDREWVSVYFQPDMLRMDRR